MPVAREQRAVWRVGKMFFPDVLVASLADIDGRILSAASGGKRGRRLWRCAARLPGIRHA